MMVERIYYMTFGDSEQKCIDLAEQHGAFSTLFQEWAEGYGALGSWSGNIVGGIIVERSNELPYGWRDSGHSNNANHLWLAPNKRTKKGKEIAAEMQDLPRPFHSSAISRAFDAGEFISVSGGQTTISYLHFEKLCGKYILSVPVNAYRDFDRTEINDFVPPDATELKMSEYYALKEKAAA
ncbi:hypothetical protein JY97_00510 [Alkalispirochaeta odontotermitis]|nr:hypothetical protein JY97_00510 [Alkalispirochaeta odontotermitis]